MIEAAAMTKPALESRWLPVLLAVLAADVNFWYWASTGENDADYLGMGLFLVFGIVWGRRLLKRHSPRNALAMAGAFLAIAAMALREIGTFDRGYIPPYAVFVVFTLISGLLPG
jgi:predicted MFS family arabinose efflux permease